MRPIPVFFCLILAILVGPVASASRLEQVDASLGPDLYIWTDTCNVYVVRDGDAALLINLGDGGVLDHLEEIGVRQVEWVLFTHHHRELCQGAIRLQGAGARLAAPKAERAFFEQPADFRKMDPRLNDPFTVYGASYVRPPILPVPLAHTFEDGDTFTWRGREIRCVETAGPSPGAMTYLLPHGDTRLAFSGGVMLDDARMHTWFDTEWDYGYGSGIQALRQSVDRLLELAPAAMLPSHGPTILQRASEQLMEYRRKLVRLEALYARGYGVESASNAYQDTVSSPTVVPDVWQISPSLFKFKRPSFWGNFGMILSESGRALVVDCGLLSEEFLDASLEGMKEHFGLKAIDAVIITHMHGDHFLQAPYLREKWGAQVWALDNMVDKMERPQRFDYAAMIQSYGHRQADGSSLDHVLVDRAFRPGETFQWEGRRFTVDWMPGQTEFALCLHGEIDGRLVAFTGDNIMGDPNDPQQTGHEAVVARNSAILEEGYIYSAEFLMTLQPDLLMAGHSFVVHRPAPLIERYRNWACEMRDAFQSLSPDSDYRYRFDPYWVRAEPYRVETRCGQGAGLLIHVRNFRSVRQRHRVVLQPPPGLQVEPMILEAELAGGSRRAYPVFVRADANATPGVHLIGMDITLDGQRYGQWFDFVVAVLNGQTHE